MRVEEVEGMKSLIRLASTPDEQIFLEPVSDLVLDVFRDNEKIFTIEKAIQVFRWYPTKAREQALYKLRKKVKKCARIR